ncbi:50S ribosomal protein L13 [Candidatus Pacearchaeota archaeon]|nr:MAG: 50S ribosomal protein L13 [Candidatus Pacearchaeota archaeon]
MKEKKLKIIDGKGTILGRLASYAAKEALKGEEIVILNCNEVIISGNKKATEDNFLKKRKRVGSSQKGPKHSRLAYRIVKRAIRGMLPEHRFGRGREAFKRIKCYNEAPKEFEEKEKIKIERKKPIKYSRVKEFSK